VTKKDSEGKSVLVIDKEKQINVIELRSSWNNRKSRIQESRYELYHMARMIKYETTDNRNY